MSSDVSIAVLASSTRNVPPSGAGAGQLSGEFAPDASTARSRAAACLDQRTGRLQSAASASSAASSPLVESGVSRDQAGASLGEKLSTRVICLARVPRE